ncbi:hypothetical protein Pelo_7891 [Pelomyxa schiedti]|nr:hypothetical protein Pelo_7891 [Pelomyxa schiedti]
MLQVAWPRKTLSIGHLLASSLITTPSPLWVWFFVILWGSAAASSICLRPNPFLCLDKVVPGKSIRDAVADNSEARVVLLFRMVLEASSVL